MFALFSNIFKMVQKAVQPLSKSKVAALMGTALSREGLASFGKVVGKSTEMTYVSAGVPLEGMMDNLTNQR